MPIYEYECSSCTFRFQRLVMLNDPEEKIACPECGAKELKKLISRVAYHVSEKDRLSSYDPVKSKSDAFYRDTRNIGLDAKKKAQKLGMNLGDQFEAKLERLRTDPGSFMKDNE